MRAAGAGATMSLFRASTMPAHRASRPPSLAARRPALAPLAARRPLGRAASPRIPLPAGAPASPSSSANAAASNAASSRTKPSAAATAAAPTTTNDAAPGDRSAWFQAWWPVAAIENLKPDEPNALELFGEKLVAWRTASGEWVVQADRCPHRLAPLSDGFVAADGGSVVCSYHGYAFNNAGRCVSIAGSTAAPGSAAEATALGSARACVRTLPARSVAGLLFAWPDPESAPAAAAARAAATPVPLPDSIDIEGGAFLPLSGRWFQRDLPFCLTEFQANVADPAHAVFAHHGVAGFDATTAPRFSLAVCDDRGRAGFSLRQAMVDPSKRGSYIHFAPQLVYYEPDPASGLAEGADAAGAGKKKNSRGPGGTLDTHLIFYASSLRPGWTRFMGASVVTDRATGQPSKLASIFGTALPAWLRHVLG